MLALGLLVGLVWSPLMAVRDVRVEGADRLDPATVQGRAAFRCTSPDYLPIVGPLADAARFDQAYASLRKDARQVPDVACPWLDGLYVNSGHGSRGLITAPLSAELLAACDDLGAELVVTLGALLADTPHTRPIPVTGTATEPELVDRLDLEQSTYEGPTGIVGVFNDACTQLDIAAVSYWAAVPHYVAQPPCPKATLALLGQLEELLEAPMPIGDLADDAKAWERGVDELAAEDEDVADYVRALEETRDTAELPEASGEAIAREFERYLKRREDPGG